MSNRIINESALSKAFNTEKVLVVYCIKPNKIRIYLDCPDHLSKNDFNSIIRETISHQFDYEVEPYVGSLDDYKNKINVPNIVLKYAKLCDGTDESIKECVGSVFEFYGYKILDIYIDEDGCTVFKRDGFASDDELYRLTLYVNEIVPNGIVALVE